MTRLTKEKLGEYRAALKAGAYDDINQLYAVAYALLVGLESAENAMTLLLEGTVKVYSDGSCACLICHGGGYTQDAIQRGGDGYYALRHRDGCCVLASTAGVARWKGLPRTGLPQIARPLSEWHEDFGPVLWWKLPVEEPPYIGEPDDDDWPGYHTHWTQIVVPLNHGNNT